jgi:cyclin C
MGMTESYSAHDDNMRIYLHSLILAFGRQLSLRQRVIGTAEVYLSRFFTRASIHEVNVYLVVASCVYVACKAEECPQHIRTVTSEARVLWPDYISPDPTKIAECEFYLIEELDTYLIVHHPYRSLNGLVQAMSDMHSELALSSDELQSVWSSINDSYATDLLLICAPHIIAMACIYMTIVLKSPLVRPSRPPERIKARIDLLVSFLGESGIDVEKLSECVQEMISLYKRWELYDENACRNQLAKSLVG